MVIPISVLLLTIWFFVSVLVGLWSSWGGDPLGIQRLFGCFGFIIWTLVMIIVYLLVK